MKDQPDDGVVRRTLEVASDLDRYARIVAKRSRVDIQDVYLRALLIMQQAGKLGVDDMLHLIGGRNQEYKVILPIRIGPPTPEEEEALSRELTLLAERSKTRGRKAKNNPS